MNRSYPLYEELKRRAEANADKNIDIWLLSTTITNIAYNSTPEDTKAHYDEIQALIMKFTEEKDGTVIVLSHGAKTITGGKDGKGILNYTLNLEPKLQRILAEYIEDPDLTNKPNF